VDRYEKMNKYIMIDQIQERKFQFIRVCVWCVHTYIYIYIYIYIYVQYSPFVRKLCKYHTTSELMQEEKQSYLLGIRTRELYHTA
jgi:hypothetical protein